METGDNLFQIYLLQDGHSREFGQVVRRIFPDMKDRIRKIHGISELSKSLPILLLLPEGAILPDNLTLPAGSVVVVSSEETRQLHILAKQPISVISCGFHSKDTVTLSSRQEDGAVVSLLREITNPDGETVEPLDVPLHLHPGYPDYPLMAAAAASFCCQFENHNT